MQHPDLFETVDKTARIFRRLPGRSPELRMQWQRLPLDYARPVPIPTASHRAEGTSLEANRVLPCLRGRADSPMDRFKELLGNDAGRSGTGCAVAKRREVFVRGIAVLDRRASNRARGACAAPMKNCTRSTRRCNRRTRSWRPRKKSCSHSMRSCTRSICACPKKWMSSINQ